MNSTRNTRENRVEYDHRSPPASPSRTVQPAAGVSIYDNEIPPFVAGELERLYESVYCTLARFDIYGTTSGASTYVARTAGKISALFLFREEGGEIKVFNQQASIDAAHIQGFAETVFSRYQSAHIISFYAINTRIRRMPFPFQQFTALEEHVLNLPATPQAYMDSLGKNSRRNLRSGEKRLRKDFPSFRYEVFSKSEASENTVREIIRLTAERMAGKNKDAYIGEEETRRIVRMVRACGLVGVATIDGRVCAGNIWYCAGTRHVIHIIAHDPAYDDYALGSYVVFLTCCECIRRGGSECWMMGGGSVFKSRFLARPTYLDSVVIFRSRFRLLLNWRRVSATAARQVVRRLKQGVLRLARGKNTAAALAAKALALARTIKRRTLPHAGGHK